MVTAGLAHARVETQRCRWQLSLHTIPWLTICEAYKSVGPLAAAPVLPPLVLLLVPSVSVLLRT